MTTTKLKNIRLSTEMLDASQISSTFIHKDGTIDNGNIKLSGNIHLSGSFSLGTGNSNGINSLQSGAGNAYGKNSQSFGNSTTSASYSLAQGTSYTYGYQSIAMGDGCRSGRADYVGDSSSKKSNSGYAAFAIGRETSAIANYSHAEGYKTYIPFIQYDIGGQHTEGQETSAIGTASHAEGYQNCILSSGSYSHAEGSNNVISGSSSHAEGIHGYAYGYASHSQGNSCSAIGPYSFASGQRTYAKGAYTFVQGTDSRSSYDGQIIMGISSVGLSNEQHAFVWNGNSGDSISSHGIGTFTINPYSLLSGFYVGDKKMSDIIDSRAKEASKIEKIKTSLSFLSDYVGGGKDDKNIPLSAMSKCLANLYRELNKQIEENEL